MKIKKILAAMLATAMLGSAFVGCAPSGGSDTTTTTAPAADDSDPFRGEDNIKLTVWSPDKAVALFKKQCDNFIKKYPDKKITIDVKIQGEDDAATAIQNDPEAAADVFGFACNLLNTLYDSKVINNVFDPEEVIANNSEGSVQAATIDGKLWAFPETGDNGYYLVYDKTIITEEDAKSLEGILAACKKAGKKFLMNAGNGFFSCTIPFTGGLKPDGIKQDEEGNDIQQFNDYNEDEVIASMQAWGTLMQEYRDLFIVDDVNKIAGKLKSGELAAGIDGIWNLVADQTAAGDRFGVAKLPTIKINGKDTQIISMHGFKLLGCNKYSKFPEASQLLAAYLTSEECQLERAKEIGWGPSNIKAAESDVVKNNAALSAILEQSKYAVPQVNLVMTFWDPMANLGNKLYAENAKLDKATLKALLDTTITAIKDE